MKKKRVLLSAILGFLLLVSGGCGARHTMHYFEKDNYFERAMNNMQTGTMVQSLETKAILHAIYLNHVDPKLYNDGEYFFIGTYIADDFRDPSKQGLFNELFWLKLNGLVPLKIEELEEDNVLRKSMPLVSRWNRYFRVKFKTSKSNLLKLTYENARYGKIVLTYQKDELKK